MIRDDNNSAGSGSYVLNAMDEREREEFEAQLAGSDELRNEVTELTDTAVLLGLAVTPVTPPRALKQNIMARLSQTPQLPKEVVAEPFAPVRTLRAVPTLASEEQRQEAPVASSSPAATKAQARWFARPAVALVAAAAAVAIIVGGITVGTLANQNTGTSQQADALATINTASDVQRASASVSTGGTATLVWSAKLGKSVLIGKNLKALATGKTYELWYINAGGQATPAGTFESKGSGTIEAALTGTMGKGDTVGVTVEPAGGSKKPTSTPVVAIQSA